mmetsp:Transcript_23564/g.35282  ORF Transcript_23564/g.35282 Transcript_23564/m.35282 type:complete len:579 (+) Transcript_23564:56-1792(+)
MNGGALDENILRKIFRFHTWQELEVVLLVSSEWYRIVDQVRHETNWTSTYYNLSSVLRPNVERMFAQLKHDLKLCSRPKFGILHITIDSSVNLEEDTIKKLYRQLVRRRIIPGTAFHLLGIETNFGILHVSREQTIYDSLPYNHDLPELSYSRITDTEDVIDAEDEFQNSFSFTISLGSMEGVGVVPFSLSNNGQIVSRHEDKLRTSCNFEKVFLDAKNERGRLKAVIVFRTDSEHNFDKIASHTTSILCQLKNRRLRELFHYLEKFQAKHHTSVPVFGAGAGNRVYINGKSCGCAGIGLYGNIDMDVMSSRELSEIGSSFVLYKGEDWNRFRLGVYTSSMTTGNSRECSPYECVEDAQNEVKASPCIVARIFLEKLVSSNERSQSSFDGNSSDSKRIRREHLVDICVESLLAMELELNICTEQQAQIMKMVCTKNYEKERIVGRFCILKSCKASEKEIRNFRGRIRANAAIFGMMISSPFRALSAMQQDYEEKIENGSEVRSLAQNLRGICISGSYTQRPLGVEHVNARSIAFKDSAMSVAVVSQRSKKNCLYFGESCKRRHDDVEKPTCKRNVKRK